VKQLVEMTEQPYVPFQLALLELRRKRGRTGAQRGAELVSDGLRSPPTKLDQTKAYVASLPWRFKECFG
jgi:hypothetical protein